jgi:hypothetical protein
MKNKNYQSVTRSMPYSSPKNASYASSTRDDNCLPSQLALIVVIPAGQALAELNILCGL